MFRTHLIQNRRSIKPAVNLLGFQAIGLDAPSTLWVGSDQLAGLPYFRTRYGFPWNTEQSGGGSLALIPAGWGIGNNPIVQISGGGAAVKVGLACPLMASGNLTLQYDFTWSCPVYWPAVVGGAPYTSFAETNGEPVATISRSAPGILTSDGINWANSGFIAGAPQTPPQTIAALTGFNTTLTRRGLLAVTSQVRGGNRVWQVRVRTAAGELNNTSAAIVSVAAGLPLDQFSMGYRELPPAYNSANIGFGGACCWRRIGASDAQLTAILDNWARFYPLV
jgi:hypothetical protein